MYTPSHYRIDDPQVVRVFIERHSFRRARPRLREWSDCMGMSKPCLEKMIRAFDADYLAQWSGLPEEHRSSMNRGIVGFEVEVERVEATLRMYRGK